jgi:hypothetical protein
VEEMKSLPYHSDIRIGNVIRCPHGDLWIVTNVNDGHDNPVTDTIEAISFDSENVTACQRLHDYDDRRQCSEDYGFGCDVDCDVCHGTGLALVHVPGWKRSKVLASNAKDFILKGVRKQFDMDQS